MTLVGDASRRFQRSTTSKRSPWEFTRQRTKTGVKGWWFKVRKLTGESEAGSTGNWIVKKIYGPMDSLDIVVCLAEAATTNMN